MFPTKNSHTKEGKGHAGFCFLFFFSSAGHPSFICGKKERLCPPPLWHSFSLLADKPHSRIRWLIIYQSNEMPKPRETRSWEWKGRRCRLIYIHSDTHTLAVVMDGNNISIGTCSRRSFQICVATKGTATKETRKKKKKLKTWVMGWNLPEEPQESLISNPWHVRCVEPGNQ